MKKYCYIGLTIGPIYKTLEYAKSTKEICSSSLFFSNFIKDIIPILTKDFEIVTPCSPNSVIKDKDIGLFPDRLIARKKTTRNDENGSEIYKLFENAVNETKKKFKKYYGINKDGTFSKIGERFLEEYYKFNTVCLVLDENVDPIQSLFPYLDSIEKQVTFLQLNSDYPFNPDVNPVNALDDILKNDSFPSIPDIAKKELKKDSASVNKYHNYIAIIHADGDNISKIFKALFLINGIEGIQNFSADLMAFGNKASSIVKNFGGVPIYFGGDDMLFFAPLKYKDMTVFDLIDKLNQHFTKFIYNNEYILNSVSRWNLEAYKVNGVKKIEIPTLSFGISFTYHKFPMSEAIGLSRNLLFKNSKEFPGKNTVSILLQEHSGQSVLASIKQDTDSWALIIDFLSKKFDEKHLRSIQYKIDPLRNILKEILCGFDIEKRREFLLKNLIDNYFNEEVHVQEFRNFIVQVFSILLQIYRDSIRIYGNSNYAAEYSINTIYSILKLKHFYTQTIKK